MHFLYDNIAAIAVSAVACAFAWIFGGTVAEYLTPVMPWLWALLFEAMLCFPQHLYGESAYDARSRVWFEMKQDPVVWLSAGFVLLLAFPFLNKGLCPNCDYAAINIAGANPAPMVPFAPFCVNRMHHWSVFTWYVPALTAMIAVRHSLLKRGKRLVMEIVVWNGVLLSVLGAVQQVTGAKFPLWWDFPGEGAYFFSTFGYPNMAGDYFTTLFAISVGLWRWKHDQYAAEAKSERGESTAGRTAERTFWRKHIYFIPVVIFFFSALTTLSRAAILLVSALALVFFVHTFASFFVHMPKVMRVKASAVSVAVLIGIGICIVAFMPDNLQKEVDSIDTTAILDRVTGRGQYHTRVAVEIWKDHPIFGCGGWGYKHFCISKMTDAELCKMQTYGGINVHNDYLQILAEHGLAGLGLLAAIVFYLLRPVMYIWGRLIKSIRFSTSRRKIARPNSLFVFPAPAFCILASAVATFIHGFGDCPLRSPAVLTLFFVSLAAIDGFIPRLSEHSH